MQSTFQKCWCSSLALTRRPAVDVALLAIVAGNNPKATGSCWSKLLLECGRTLMQGQRGQNGRLFIHCKPHHPMGVDVRIVHFAQAGTGEHFGHDVRMCRFLDAFSFEDIPTVAAPWRPMRRRNAEKTTLQARLWVLGVEASFRCCSSNSIMLQVRSARQVR